MNKLKFPNTYALSSLIPAAVFCLFLGSVFPSSAYELKDVGLISGGSQTYLKISFSAKPTEGEFPLYFQKTDPERGTLTISFLETETPFPLGKYALDAGSPWVEELWLKKLTSPSGKNFLGVELKLKAPPPAEVLIAPQGKGGLKVLLESASKGKYSWWLGKAAKVTKPQDDYLSAPATPVPPTVSVAEAARIAAEAAKIGKAIVAQPEPETPQEGPSAGSGPSRHAAGTGLVLKEIKLMIAKSQEDLLLVFDPPAAPAYTVEKDPAKPLVLRILLDDASSSLSRPDFVLPRSGVFKSVGIYRRGRQKLTLEFNLAGNAPVHILPREGGLALTGAGKGDAATPFKWSSLKPQATTPQVEASVDAVTSAHEEGAALDAGATGTAKGKSKALSSSQIFSLGKGGKSMILLKDSATLKDKPGSKKTIRKVPLGEKVERLEKQGSWIKVATGTDTGFIRQDQAVYEDELTLAQSKALEAQLAAKQVKLDAAQAKLETARQAQEAAAAKAEQVASAKAEQMTAAPAQAEAPAAGKPASSKTPAHTTPVSLPGQPQLSMPSPGDESKLAVSGNPELAGKLAEEKKAAELEKMRVEPEEKRISYNSYGRRDPFIPVEQGASDNGIDIDQMKVVGIIWQSQEPMAVLEHNRETGLSFTVKQGDPVHNGRVSRITRDAVTFDISEYGISRSYSLKLVSSQERAKK